MSLDTHVQQLMKMFDDVQIAAILCFQWGDTGKGKFVDALAYHWADVIARGTGGNNAGHTVVIGDEKYIFHLIPSGILYDKDGKINILGNGMVIDPKALVAEMDLLDSKGLPYNNLMISQDAEVIMPYHIVRDQRKNQSQDNGGIGSTGRGIGPTYMQKIARRGIKIRDLLDDDLLAQKIAKAKSDFPELPIDAEAIIEELRPYVDRLKPLVRNTINEMHRFREQGKKILLEGAQGLLLSVELGTTPFGTSSDCSLNGTATGVGLPANAVDLPLGLINFPYMKRVGGGPFPTELSSWTEGHRRSDSEIHCARSIGARSILADDELKEYGIPFTGTAADGSISYDLNHPTISELMASSNLFDQGVGIRMRGNEYGATTGRPRRTGWTDLEAAKYAVRCNTPNLVLTKVDVLADVPQFGLGVGYEDGLPFDKDGDALYGRKPVIKMMPGYGAVDGAETFNELPENLRDAIQFTEKFTGGNVKLISTGPDRKQIICRS